MTVHTLLLNSNGIPVLTRPYGDELTRLLCDADFVKTQSVQFNEHFREGYTVEVWDTSAIGHPLDIPRDLLSQLDW